MAIECNLLARKESIHLYGILLNLRAELPKLLVLCRQHIHFLKHKMPFLNGVV